MTAEPLRAGPFRQGTRVLLRVASHGLARAAVRFPSLLPLLPLLPEAVRRRLPAALEATGASLPRVTSVRHGVSLHLDLADDVQREIHLRVFEPQETELVDELSRKGGTCLDVGANVGFYTCLMGLRVGRGGSVHAFEPEPRNVERIRTNVALNDLEETVRIHEHAVSDRAGRSVFHRHDEVHSGWGSLERHPRHREELQVEAVTLDGFLGEEEIDEVDLLKIDVEGSELRVLRGARSALRHRKIRHILVEWNGYWSQRLRTDPSEFLGILTDSGYRPVRLNLDRLDEIVRDPGGVGSAVNLLFRRTGP